MKEKNKKNTEFSWSDRIKLDIHIIDEQHIGFFKLIDNTRNFDLINDNLSIQKSKYVIKELEQYLLNHFHTEEELMYKSEYKDVELHKQQHRYFIMKIEEFKLEYSFKGFYLFDKITDFMRKWFLNHIINTDSLYKNAVKKYIDFNTYKE